MTEEKKQSYQDARDLVLAAFILMVQNRIPSDAGMIGRLQQYLNLHVAKHGDVRRVVAITLDPRRSATISLNENENAALERATAIIESVVDPTDGWESGPVGVYKAWPGESQDAIAKSSAFGIVEETDVIQESELVPNITTPEPKKPGRKKKSPIEEATANAQKKVDERPCC